MSIPEADQFIKNYFARYAKVKEFLDAQKEKAKKDGFLTTLLGRRSYFPNINAANMQLRQYAERSAINAPIQGSAADVIRRAMIRMPEALTAAKLSGRMLMQVHDELVFEVPEAEVDATRDVVRKVMEHAAEPVLQLTVPLTVEAKAGLNWDEAH
jgi:DNA polymerase-1